MTPVEATSTSSARQPSSRGRVFRRPRATSRPAAPVQAFAQPLLATTARAVPPDRSRCSRDTMTGAACAWLVVNRRRRAGRTVGHDEREVEPPDALMPQATPGRAEAARGGDAAGRGFDRERDGRGSACQA